MVDGSKCWNVKTGNQRLEIIAEDFMKLMGECDRLRTLSENKDLQYDRETKEFLINLLGVLDDFEIVFTNIEDRSKDMDIGSQAKIWIENFSIVKTKLVNIMKAFGVVPIEALEGKAIAGRHTIEGTRNVEGLSDDTIVEVIRQGFLWKNEVLRKASVITASNNKREA